jgi:subtilase family serine protease
MTSTGVPVTDPKNSLTKPRLDLLAASGGGGTAPDLAVSALSNPPASAAAGGSFSVTDTTANQGTATAGASTTRFRLSLDSTITSADPLLTGSRAVPTLVAGGSSSGTTTVTIPLSLTPGTYYLGACADDLGAVAESNETNNCRASTTTIQVTGGGGTFSISGNVSTSGGGGDSGPLLPAAPLAGVTMTLTGAASATTTTDSNGNYTFTGLANGNYTVTPSLSGYVFTPTSRNVTVSGANVTGQNFTGTATGGGTLDLVVSALSNPPASAAAGGSFAVTDTTANQGTATAGASTTRYRLSLDSTITGSDPLLTGTRAVPSLAAGGSSSGTTTVTIPLSLTPGTYYLGACADDLGAVAESNETNNCRASTTTIQVTGGGGTFSISGNVSTSGGGGDSGPLLPAAPLAGVTMTLTGAASATTTTDSNGNYTFTGLANGNYTVTPSLSGYVFTPTSRNVTVSGANVTGQNFTATAAATYTLSGTVTASGGGALSGVTMTLSGSASATTTTNASGNYSFTVANGSYTITPSLSGYTFTPTSRNVTVSGANVTGQNFTGTATGGGTLDLVVSALSNPPASAAAGGSFAVTDTTANQGTATAGASTTRFRLSLDSTITGSDPLLTGSRAVGSLAAGGSSSGTTTVTIPLSLTPGTYYLGACADDLGAVAESNETNNCRASTTTIQVTGGGGGDQ